MDEHKPKTGPVKRQSGRQSGRKVARKLSQNYLRNSALYYLQRHPTSVANFLTVMKRKMKRSEKDHPGQDLEGFTRFLEAELVPEFERAGFLNDVAYASALAGSLRRRGLPQRAVEMRLKMKGVETPEAPEGHDDEVAAFLYAKRKRLGPFATREREPQKDLAALARAGFSYEVCRKVMDASAEEALERVAT